MDDVIPEAPRSDILYGRLAAVLNANPAGSGTPDEVCQVCHKEWSIYTSGCTGGTLLLDSTCSIITTSVDSQPTAVVSEDSCA